LTGRLSGDQFLAGLRRHGADLVTGVPCSFLTPVINAAIADGRTVFAGAASEGEAVGIAAGWWLAGGSPVVMGQNSGLGNMINPLTSLTAPAGIPVLILCTWRGEPGLRDEPQHEVMGRVMTDLLDVIGVEWQLVDGEPDQLGGCLDRAFGSMQARSLPHCLVLRKGVIADQPLRQGALSRPRVGTLRTGDPPGSRGVAGSRAQVLQRLLEVLPDGAPVVATTGKTGRELFTIADHPQHFYLVGAMGCASAVGLGICLRLPGPVVVVDGDGAALMKLGNFATIGALAPSGLIHVLLDNLVHDSTGGQRTSAGAVSFPRIAIACGYRTAASCTSLAGLERAISAALASPGPHLVHVRIAAGSMPGLGRPTVRPYDVARRFREHLARSAGAAGAGRQAAGAARQVVGARGR
jgi:phosphonopyruvate decarboxylase